RRWWCRHRALRGPTTSSAARRRSASPVATARLDDGIPESLTRPTACTARGSVDGHAPGHKDEPMIVAPLEVAALVDPKVIPGLRRFLPLEEAEGLRPEPDQFLFVRIHSGTDVEHAISAIDDPQSSQKRILEPLPDDVPVRWNPLGQALRLLIDGESADFDPLVGLEQPTEIGDRPRLAEGAVRPEGVALRKIAVDDSPRIPGRRPRIAWLVVPNPSDDVLQDGLGDLPSQANGEDVLPPLRQSGFVDIGLEDLVASVGCTALRRPGRRSPSGCRCLRCRPGHEVPADREDSHEDENRQAGDLRRPNR